MKTKLFALSVAVTASITSLVTGAEVPPVEATAELHASSGILVPAERTALFPADKAADLIRQVTYRPPAATGYWTPTASDLAGVETTLVEYLQTKDGPAPETWSRYRRQVTGITRGDEKFLFIYYFPFDAQREETLKAQRPDSYDPDTWKKRPYHVFDGGPSFFRVLYDLKQKRFIWYECNGLA